jgi:hypothetical protein
MPPPSVQWKYTGGAIMAKQKSAVSGYRLGKSLPFFVFIIFGLAVFLQSTQ